MARAPQRRGYRTPLVVLAVALLGFAVSLVVFSVEGGVSGTAGADAAGTVAMVFVVVAVVAVAALAVRAVMHLVEALRDDES